MKEKQRKHEAINSIALIPSNVTLEVLSNGTTHLRPCVIIRTPQKVYLFNCPEGTTRFLPSLRLKSLNVCDIFATRGELQLATATIFLTCATGANRN
uniref:Lactamase_B_4 domain-containing protein n=1 Tax=Ascaris lumbricoides TaxID=6252 RepID=A0A0M3HKW4_ASCLU